MNPPFFNSEDSDVVLLFSAQMDFGPFSQIPQALQQYE